MECRSWNEKKESCPRGQRWKHSQWHSGPREKALLCRRSGGSRDLCILLPEDDGTRSGRPLDLLLPYGCADDLLGLCLWSAPSEDPSMDAPKHVPLCDPLHRRTIRKQRNSRRDEKSCRHDNSRRNLPGRLFPASGNRSYCLLHSRKIPRPLPAGGVESIVRREKTGRIGAIRTAENPLLSAYRMNSSM